MDTQHAGRPAIDSRLRLQFEQAQQAWVLLYPEGMVKLNQSAGEIMRRCDGQRDTAAIVAELEAAFEITGIAPEVDAFLDHATRQGWLRWN